MASCNPTRKKSSASSLSMWRTILMALTTLPLSVLSQELIPANSTTSSTAPSITSLSAVDIIEGQTILSNYYTTITYSPTASASSGKDSHHSGLSKKNRNIIIGCVVGIGAPLILILLILIYMFCVQPKKTDFIDSDGKIVTAYRSNIFTKIWYFLLGKKIGETEKFSSDSPIGSNNIQNFDYNDADEVMHDENIHPVYDDSEASIDENYYTKPNNGLNITNY
ncbi:ALH_1b_G0020560.mRNA.1.CDS.1 [Saccharomyces cerevisiae]|nr:ADQ_G0020350.mRNA.1.CDS.1 [Saccharomyces cerevisiae]CAI4481193.1 ALH_1c_G0020510.mRNA.1.CDS.1 [Saccharomyces cerevisiae]CAI4495751.1 CEL_1a_G0020580.mRNA.1.CDS.1 [Saccharomyces cerevisiae]CAI4496219.1 ALH_1b_G0020560.mRNA.1.CDS.1 [Saccharomyces cerevisiae]CAI5273265.1 CMF_HP2_G0020020.mRNA.1.CDS.1 [Saccharomyces cerevisiae]